MRLNEVLTESAIQELNEGPFGQAVAGAARGFARGAGAVAGGLSAIPGQVKKGYSAGAAAVRGEPEPANTAPARSSSNVGKRAAQAPEPATTSASMSTYRQTKDLVAKLDKKGKQRILAILAKDLGIMDQPAPAKKVVSKMAPDGTPAAKPKVVRGGKARAA
jgi:hypothetical protein